MSLIQTLLDNILSAVYGEEVRGSIHDAIDQCYKDATGNPESVAAVVEQNDYMANLLENTPYTTAIEDTDTYVLPIHTIRDNVTTEVSTWSSVKLQNKLDDLQDACDSAIDAAKDENNQKISSIFKVIEGSITGSSGIKTVTLNPATYGIAAGELDKYIVLSAAQTDQYGYWQNLISYYNDYDPEIAPSLALSPEENKMYFYIDTSNNSGSDKTYKYRAVLTKIK